MIERLNAPVPKFFVKLRNFSMLATWFSTLLLALPQYLPEGSTVYVIATIVGGVVSSLVSQMTKEHDPASTKVSIPLDASGSYIMRVPIKPIENSLPPVPAFIDVPSTVPPIPFESGSVGINSNVTYTSNPS
jgi:hypothetical protein